AAGALRKNGAGDRDMALEHAREALAHLGTRRADRKRARHVRGAVLVLGTRIDQKKLARGDASVAPPRDAIVNDGPVRSGSGDGRKRHVLEQVAVAAKALQGLDRGDL